MFKELERLKKDPQRSEEVVPTPLQPRILNYDSLGSSRGYREDSNLGRLGSQPIDLTLATRITTTRSPGYTPGSSFHDPNNGNFNNRQSYATTNSESLQDAGISTIMAKELQKLKDMIASVPGVVQPIPEVSSESHKLSKFAYPICDAEIPKRFQTLNMKLCNGTTDPEEHVAQYRERMEINPIPLN